MTHGLRRRHPLNAVGLNPLVATLRYRCECAANEVLTINVVMDIDVPEDRFVWTMQQLYRDLRFEIDQHLGPPPQEKSPPA